MIVFLFLKVLHGILELGGFVFVNLYGNQAKRLFNTIGMIVNKSPVLRQSLPEIQLLSLLEKYESIDKMPDRIGFIDKSFWDSVWCSLVYKNNICFYNSRLVYIYFCKY